MEVQRHVVGKREVDATRTKPSVAPKRAPIQQNEKVIPLRFIDASDSEDGEPLEETYKVKIISYSLLKVESVQPVSLRISSARSQCVEIDIAPEHTESLDALYEYLKQNVPLPGTLRGMWRFRLS
jgi:hypothetical protein